jgi:hypothetical protein
MRHALLLVAAASLAACQPRGERSELPRAPDASTGAAGAVTGAADPNPTGAGATTGATPGDATGALGSTSPESPQPPDAQPDTPPPN